MLHTFTVKGDEVEIDEDYDKGGELIPASTQVFKPPRRTGAWYTIIDYYNSLRVENVSSSATKRVLESGAIMTFDALMGVSIFLLPFRLIASTAAGYGGKYIGKKIYQKTKQGDYSIDLPTLPVSALPALEDEANPEPHFSRNKSFKSNLKVAKHKSKKVWVTVKDGTKTYLKQVTLKDLSVGTAATVGSVGVTSVFWVLGPGGWAALPVYWLLEGSMKSFCSFLARRWSEGKWGHASDVPISKLIEKHPHALVNAKQKINNGKMIFPDEVLTDLTTSTVFIDQQQITSETEAKIPDKMLLAFEIVDEDIHVPIEEDLMQASIIDFEQDPDGNLTASLIEFPEVAPSLQDTQSVTPALNVPPIDAQSHNAHDTTPQVLVSYFDQPHSEDDCEKSIWASIDLSKLQIQPAATNEQKSDQLLIWAKGVLNSAKVIDDYTGDDASLPSSSASKPRLQS